MRAKKIQRTFQNTQTHFIGVLVPDDLTHTLEDCRRYMNENFGCNQCKYHKHDAARNPITPNQYTLLVQYDQENDTLHALFPDGSGTAVGYDEKRREGIIVMRNMEQPRYIMAFHIPKLHHFIGDDKNEQ